MTTAENHKWSVADSAHWAAFFRANESKRSDALFRDPFAERLAGDIGVELGRKLGNNQWAWSARTHLVDNAITKLVEQGVDTVVNLAAGLDARPFRMKLPASLRWYEVDLPQIMATKRKVLGEEKPVCHHEKIELDLAQREARRELFAKIGATAKNALVLTEGLLIYLDAAQVDDFARDLAEVKPFRHWILDIVSPSLLRMMQNKFGRDIHNGAPMKFGPVEGAHYFDRLGWRAVETHSLLKHAAGLGRLPLPLRLAAMLPQRDQHKGSFLWNAVCLLDRK